MANFNERFLLGFTSPRNPELISEYIRVIEENKLEGKTYNKEFQEAFYNALSKARVAGQDAGNAKDKALAGRDKLTRMPQALGFFITQNNKPFKITQAGKLLKDPNLFDDVLLHQILKYQLPSKLHREGSGIEGKFRIKPFLELLRLINKMGYLTYKEFLVYGMTLTHYKDFDKTVSLIEDYRKRRSNAKADKTPLNKFDLENHINLFDQLYKDVIESKDFSTRESLTKTHGQYRSKKLSVWKDYADSIFRLIRATGLVTYTRGRSLSINPHRSDEVDFILTNVDREIHPIDIAREEFDNYISNPSIPVLLNDNEEYIKATLEGLECPLTGTEDIYALKTKLHELRNLRKETQIIKISSSLKKRQEIDIKDIIDTFRDIKDNNIEPSYLRPALFEWNTWRAMTMINHGDIRGNFPLDETGMPTGTAAGGKSDIVGDYGEFDIGIEVTLSTGKKQYEMEGEPVSRHIGNMQLNKKSFGIFIANSLNENVIQHFHLLACQKSKAYNNKEINVIPLDTDTFIRFFEKASRVEITPSDLISIHEHSLKTAREVLVQEGDDTDWHDSVINKLFSLVQ